MFTHILSESEKDGAGRCYDTVQGGGKGQENQGQYYKHLKQTWQKLNLRFLHLIHCAL
jgi:hypothetical protein